MIRFEAGLLAEELSKELHSWAWVTGDQLLRSSCLMGLEAGLLPHGVQLAKQFFPMKTGDLVLLKDCQIGGPGRDRLALIQCLREPKSGEPGVWMANGFYAPSTAGMKLPPIPLRNGGEVNEAVMAALGPCEARLRKEIQTQDRIRGIAMKPSFKHLWTEKALAEEMTREKREMKARISELPDGEISTDLSCGKELIRLKLEVENGTMTFNFAGTSAAGIHSLPLTATSGIVRSTVREWLNWPRALSSSCESLISMSTPTGCMLNPPAKASCDEKLSAAAALLKTAIESALHLWDRRVTRGLTNYFDAKASLQFEAAPPFTVVVPTGTAAVDSQEGISFFDQRASGLTFSPEKLEASCPVLVEKIEECSRDTSKVKVAGGPGLSLCFRALRPGKIAWDLPPVFKLTMKKGQAPYEKSEIEIKRQGEVQSWNGEGFFDIQEGDLVTIRSGSGGGLC